MSDNTILDKIITQRHADEMRAFDPVRAVENILQGITEREQAIIKERFGLLEDGTLATLEDIGRRFKVTRERVRQVIGGAIIKLRELQMGDDEVQRFVRIAQQLLRSFGGALEEKFFINELLEFAEVPNKESSRRRYVAHLEFLFNIISEAIEHRPANNARRAVYAIPGTDENLLGLAVSVLLELVENDGCPLSEKELIKKFQATPLYANEKSELVDRPVRLAREFFRSGISTAAPSGEEEATILRAYIAATLALEQNIFGEWGRRDWLTINPKRMNDKIYLVLKHEATPLHFAAITDKINALHFDHKIAKSPSVHNELILDKRFVLVGRGIYALKEWGFKRGTVTEVIIELLTHPDGLTKEQIIEEVLKRRFVKKQTILLALMNSSQFMKHSNGRYTAINKTER